MVIATFHIALYSKAHNTQMFPHSNIKNSGHILTLNKDWLNTNIPNCYNLCLP